MFELKNTFGIISTAELNLMNEAVEVLVERGLTEQSAMEMVQVNFKIGQQNSVADLIRSA